MSNLLNTASRIVHATSTLHGWTSLCGKDFRGSATVAQTTVLGVTCVTCLGRIAKAEAEAHLVHAAIMAGFAGGPECLERREAELSGEVLAQRVTARRESLHEWVGIEKHNRHSLRMVEANAWWLALYLAEVDRRAAVRLAESVRVRRIMDFMRSVNRTEMGGDMGPQEKMARFLDAEHAVALGEYVAAITIVNVEEGSAGGWRWITMSNGARHSVTLREIATRIQNGEWLFTREAQVAARRVWEQAMV